MFTSSCVYFNHVASIHVFFSIVLDETRKREGGSVALILLTKIVARDECLGICSDILALQDAEL